MAGTVLCPFSTQVLFFFFNTPETIAQGMDLILQIEYNDRPNAELIMKSKRNADLIIRSIDFQSWSILIYANWGHQLHKYE